MGNLKMALSVAGLLLLLFGVTFLFPSLFEAVYAYQPMDAALLSLGAMLFFGCGVITLAATKVGEHMKSMAMAIAFAYLLGLVHIVWEYFAGIYTTRTAIGPAIVTVLVIIWILVASQSSQAEG